MKTGNDVELTYAFFSAPAFIKDILDAHLVCAGLTLASAESAELAPVDADVRGIDVHVPNEMRAVPVLLLRNLRGHAAERKEIVRFEQLNPVFASEAFV
jgi:hypothetical protein